MKPDHRSATDLRIREFRYPDDYDTVIALWQLAGPGIHVGKSDEPAEIEKKLTRDPDLFLVFEVDGAIVGAVLGGYDGRRGMMYHLAVAEAARNQGIGDQLIMELERKLRQKGCVKYYLLVTMDNEQALRFYEKRGFQQMPLYTYGKDL
jgi:ribosomal protein S18 acetylase RimI-like enzyme